MNFLPFTELLGWLAQSKMSHKFMKQQQKRQKTHPNQNSQTNKMNKKSKKRGKRNQTKVSKVTAHATLSTQAWQYQNITNSFPGWCNTLCIDGVAFTYWFWWVNTAVTPVSKENFLDHERHFPYRPQHLSPQAFSQIRWKRLQEGAGGYLLCQTKRQRNRLFFFLLLV